MERVIGFIAERVNIRSPWPAVSTRGSKSLRCRRRCSVTAVEAAAPQTPYRPARGRRAAHDQSRGDLRRETRRPLRAARRSRAHPRRRALARRRIAGRSRNPRSRQHPFRAMSPQWSNASVEQRTDAAAGGKGTRGYRRSRHDDARRGRRRRSRLRRGPHDRQHGSPGPSAHQDRARIEHRLQRLLHADARSGAGLRRLRDQSRSDRRGTRRDRHPVGRQRRRVRPRSARRDDLLLDRRVGRGRRCRQGSQGDRHRSGTPSGYRR